MTNKFVYVFSSSATIINSMSNKVVRFEKIKDNHPNFPDFGVILKGLLFSRNRKHVNFFIRDGYFFKELNAHSL